MNITFQNQTNQAERNVTNYTDRSDYAKTAHMNKMQNKRASEVAGKTTEAASFFAGESNLNLFDNVEKSKSISDLQQEAAAMDVGISQDYMTLMSHTLSEEDYRKLSEDGFDFSEMNPEDAVTIVDKIKAELVRSGQQIAGYTDDLDMETLAAVLGSETLARSLAESFAQSDLPLTESNVMNIDRAFKMAQELEVPSEGTYQYMVDNEMDPEIWNFYLAQNSGAGAAMMSAGRDLSYLEDEQLQKQMDQVIEQSGLETTDENREMAKWLLEKNLPLTEDSLSRLVALKNVAFPITWDQVQASGTAAIAMGKNAIYASLSGESATYTSIYEKASEVMNFYESMDAQTIEARKQLEEIRFRMTAEINVKLLKSGFSIDTAPMEELITALKKAEQEIAGQYFKSEDSVTAVSKYENWNQTNRVIKELPALPASLLGTLRIGEADSMVLARFHEEGVTLKQAYEKAGESYETLMTAPRADLGDSIKKAFGNVDELAKELGLEPTEANRRAIRILGYNHMEISAEQIDRILAADTQVQDVIRKMTPAATLQMIRDGINPLEKSFDELHAYFDALPVDYKKESESFSRYLYGLEKNNEISVEERESFIGVYRLLHQIEKKDGAAIGAVINEQAALQFSNLLSAVRSGNFKHMDVRADEEFGSLKELVQKGEQSSISEQISKAYAKEQVSRIRESAQVEAATVELLKKGELATTEENLLAMQKLRKNAVNPYKELRKAGDDLWEKLSEKEDFVENYEETIEQFKEEAEEKTFLEASNSIDVKAYQMVHRQLSIMGNLANKEEYFLAMEVGEEEALVHLTFENGSAMKGGISISVQYGEASYVEANLQIKNSRIEGFCLGKTADEVTKLKEASDIFYNLINENASMGLEATKLPVVTSENIKMTRMSDNNSQEDVNTPDNGMLYRVAKLFLQAMR